MTKEEYIKTIRDQINLNDLYIEQCNRDKDEFGASNFRRENMRLENIIWEIERTPKDQITSVYGFDA